MCFCIVQYFLILFFRSCISGKALRINAINKNNNKLIFDRTKHPMCAIDNDHDDKNDKWQQQKWTKTFLSTKNVRLVIKFSICNVSSVGIAPQFCQCYEPDAGCFCRAISIWRSSAVPFQSQVNQYRVQYAKQFSKPKNRTQLFVRAAIHIRTLNRWKINLNTVLSIAIIKLYKL